MRLKAKLTDKAAREAGLFFRDLTKGQKYSVEKYGAENPNTSGGFVVPTEVSAAIAETRDKVGVFRNLARVVNMTTDLTQVPRRASGLTGYYLAENAQITESQAGWDQVTLSAKKIATISRASTELVDDAAGFGRFMVEELAYTLEAMIDAAAFAGDGTSTFAGISGIRNFPTAFVSTVGGTLAGGYVLAATGHDTFAEFDGTDFVTVIGLLPSRYHDRAVWLMSPAMWGFTCLRLVSAVGYEDGRKTFFGYPVVLTSSMPGGTTATDFSNLVVAAFGDFSQGSILGLRRDAQVYRSPTKFMEFDQIGFRAITRFDLVHHHLGDATTPGAICVLAGN